MVKQINRIVALVLLVAAVATTGCKKTEITTPPEQAHFTNLTDGAYFILTPTTTYKVPVGVTTVSNVDRTFTFSVTSPTGAVAGTHYTLDKTVATIKAGQAIDSITVRGVFAQYAAGRKDTLVFTITEANGKKSDYNATFRLLMRGPCFEGDVNLSDLLGTYTKTFETFGTAAAPGAPYGPYSTSITAVAKTGPTTGTVSVNNLWDAAATWGPITFTLDWTDPNNRTVTALTQTVLPSNAGEVSTTYNGDQVAVRQLAGKLGTFSVCTNTLTLKMNLGVSRAGTVLGFFGNEYIVTMAR